MDDAVQNLRHHIFGFDIRENWLTYEDGWDQERRNQFLFREDVKKPFSADDLAWPSLLSQNGILSLSRTDAGFSTFERFDDPDKAGANEPLWEDADAMIRFFTERWRFSNNPWCAITLSEIASTRPAWRDFWPIPNETTPPTVRDDWQLLGIDICANDGLYSGIMNCGYSADEKALAASRWKHSVNEYHLFDQLSEAEEFRKWTDNRVPEHAPFRLIGLFLIATSDHPPRGVLQKHSPKCN